jgi:hypothetical protein
VTTAIGSTSVGSAATAYTAATTATKTADTPQQDTSEQTSSGASDSVTLSDAAKAYLAASTSTDVSSVASDARAWFDAQYASLNLTSPLLDGQIAVDFTGQSRDMLSAVASDNTGLFTADERSAASQALQSRFDDAMASHVVLARHNGDYAGLYQAASDYLDQASDAERATVTWQLQKQAVTDGLAQAKTVFGKAPDTGNINDPVAALLTETSQSTDTGDTTDPVSKARAMLDAQANKASDLGTELVFDKARKVGLQVDFSNFDNDTLAAVALNQDGSFSTEESRAARQELDQRNRTSLLSALDAGNQSGNAADTGVAMLSLYSNMSATEKAALGYSDSFTDQIAQSYRALSMLQNMSSNSSSSGSSLLDLI